MLEETEFKSGKDLGEETQVVDGETIACVDCGATETDSNAFEQGWQLAPAVCPDCLRWVAVGGDECCFRS